MAYVGLGVEGVFVAHDGVIKECLQADFIGDEIGEVDEVLQSSFNVLIVLFCRKSPDWEGMYQQREALFLTISMAKYSGSYYKISSNDLDMNEAQDHFLNFYEDSDSDTDVKEYNQFILNNYL